MYQLRVWGGNQISRMVSQIYPSFGSLTVITTNRGCFFRRPFSLYFSFLIQVCSDSEKGIVILIEAFLNQQIALNQKKVSLKKWALWMRGIKGRGLEEGNGERGWRFVITFRGELFVGEIVNCCVGIHTHTHTNRYFNTHIYTASTHTSINTHTHKQILQHTHSHNKHTHFNTHTQSIYTYTNKQGWIP